MKDTDGIMIALSMYNYGFNDAIDKMLEIIDSVSDDWLEDSCNWDWHGEMKKRFLAMKGGEQ